jgi:hypothetical protein
MAVMKKVKNMMMAAGMMVCVSFANAAFAQQTTPPQDNSQQQQTQAFSDAELNQFVQASFKAAAVQQESEKAMLGVVEAETLSVEKFNEMTQAHQQQKLAELNATAEEKAAFNKAAQQIVEMQPKVEQELQQAIEKEGISIEKFEAISIAYQQNPAVQAKVQKILQQQNR